jgi:hypothetical protein
MNMLDIITRAEAQTGQMNDEQRSSFLAVASQVDNLNACIRKAVNSGLSIEVQRTARHHDEAGAWGDLMMPSVVRKG